MTNPTRPQCGGIESGGVSILKFGRSLPLVELFETFMITGLVLITVSASSFYTFRSIADLLKTEGASPTAINMANTAANSHPAWIGVGAVMFIVGVILYYLHRRISNNP